LSLLFFAVLLNSLSLALLVSRRSCIDGPSARSVS
jgi:hypothetical protein